MMFRATALTLSALKVSAIVLGGVALASGHATAKNHDVQPIRFPSAPPAHHDRADGPSAASPQADPAPAAN